MINDCVADFNGLTHEEQKIVEGILPAAKDEGGGDGEEVEGDG